MAIGVIWDEIWDEAIWDNLIWEQTSTNPPGVVSSTGNMRRHTLGLTSFKRR